LKEMRIRYEQGYDLSVAANREASMGLQMDSQEAQHNFAATALTDAVKKCERNGVPTDVTVQTIVSVAVTLLLSCTDPDGAADLLESMAAGIRHGDFTRHDDA
jgi:hypothetical protein